MPAHGETTGEIHPSAMTIAGSDSGGGAGIQADLRTFAFFGVFGASAVTAVTSQNPFEVTGIAPVPARTVALQIETVLNAIDIRAVKTGMLFSAAVVSSVCEALAAFKGKTVVDPVMISTSGKRLMKQSAASVMERKLLPSATVITPNLLEAEALAGIKISSLADMARAARICREKWGCVAVVKGGHASGPNAEDIVCSDDGLFVLSAPRVQIEKHTGHGTGCTFSSALAAMFAKGASVGDALVKAKAFVTASLVEAALLSDRKTLSGMFPPRGGLAGYEAGTTFRKLKNV